MCTWKQCVFCLLGGELSSRWLDPVGWQCYWILYSCWVSFCLCHQLLREGVEVCSYNCGLVCFSFQFLLRVFFSTLLWYVHIQNCSVFLVDWPLIIIWRPSLLVVTFFAIKFAFSDSNVATHTFLWLMFMWNIFFHLCSFNLHTGIPWRCCRFGSRPLQ